MDEIRIFIVDDEIQFANALSERLELRGYATETANSGMDALAALNNAKPLPDIILLDLKIPDMSGFDVLVEVKKKYPAIEVIMLTGHGGASAGSGSQKRGAFAFIMKPVDFGELTEKIKQAYEKKCAS